MLSNERKQQILDEEIYRSEVQIELKKKEKKKSKTWEFMNSSFGIWLLSSVALGLITWGYTQISQSLAADKKNQAEIQKYDVEIPARINNYKVLLSHLKQNGDYYNANDEFLLGGKYFVLPEFRDKSIKSLLLEQSLLVPNQRKEEIKKQINGIDKLTQTKIEATIGGGREEWQASIDNSLIRNAEKLNQIITESFNLP
jgi:hypothetical protein